MNATNLRGKNVLVTGAGGGIGRAVVAAFLAEGARVAAADVASADSLGDTVLPLRFDARDALACEKLVQDVAEKLGGIDVLVLCHGIVDEGSIDELTTTRWDDMLAVTLTSAFHLCRAVVPLMREGGSGRIIVISSQVAQKGAAGLSHYAAAKAGLIGFARSLAREVVADGILVNIVAPGPVQTPMLDRITAGGAPDLSAVPLGRAGVPEEVAPSVILLASTPGGALYVGQTLGPNGGDVMF